MIDDQYVLWCERRERNSGRVRNALGIDMNSTQRRVLHVDDDRLIRELVAHRLTADGYEVISLADPRDAISTLLAHDCRVVILDVEMPELNGLELLSQIKAYDGGVQVVMLTGLVSMTSVLESLRRGAEACHFKPIEDFSELQATLEATFAKLDAWWNTLADLARRKQLGNLPTRQLPHSVLN
jgi:DNA-binding NtrC family response regulator